MAQITTTSNDSTPHIFKLYVDCFDHIFEWLSLNELLVFRSTCKRIRAVCDHYLKLNYREAKRLLINEQQRALEFCHEPLKYFEWLEHLGFSGIELTSTEIDGIDYVLNNLKSISLSRVQLHGEFYETVLKHCARLNSLYLEVEQGQEQEMIIGTGNEWLLRHYPTLECVAVIVFSTPCTELWTFLKQNRNIREFHTTTRVLLKLFVQIKSNEMDTVTIDRLVIFVAHTWHTLSKLVNALNAHKFYKQLHVYDTTGPPIQHGVQYLSAFNNLDLLCLFHPLHDEFPIPVMESITELWLSEEPGIFHADITTQMAFNFINLKRVVMRRANLGEVQPFVRYAPKLIEIKFVELSDAVDVGMDDFIALNEDRKKLVQARKITMHFVEENFLTFKWTGKINFGLIELKRWTSKYIFS